MKTTRNMLTVVMMIAAIGLAATAAQAALVPVDIDINNSYVPSSLVEGNQFRLVFVTNGSPDATQTSLADYYNPFVTAAANSVPSLQALGTTWMAIGSTASVDARDNTYTNSVTASDASVPIYRLDGLQVATGNPDLWDGSIMAPINLTEILGPPVINAPYTGTNTAGAAWYPLGGNPLACGQTDDTDSDWIAFTQWGRPGSGYPIYAMSGIFTVTGAQEGILHIIKFLDDCDGVYVEGDEIFPPGSFLFDIENVDTGWQGVIGNCEEIPLEPGLYEITEQVPPGWIACSDNPFRVLIEAGTEPTIVYFGNLPEGEVPEPATLALLGLAACGLGGYVRRRRKA